MTTDNEQKIDTRVQRISPGLWGAKGIGLTIPEEGDSRLEFDCAHGTITPPLSASGDGKFQWKGTFAAEFPGPARSTDRDPQAIYRGRIDGDRMTFTIEATSPERTLGPFALTLGAMPRIRKCS